MRCHDAHPSRIPPVGPKYGAMSLVPTREALDRTWISHKNRGEFGSARSAGSKLGVTRVHLAGVDLRCAREGEFA
jgi:hypothetical protein